MGLVAKERKGAQAEEASLGNLGSLKRQETCLNPENTLKPECVMESEAGNRKRTQPPSIRDKCLVSSAVLSRCAKLTGTKWTEHTASCYSSSSANSCWNYSCLFPISANLQSCTHWAIYAWLCLKPVLWDNLSLGNLEQCIQSVLWKEGWGK